MPTQGYKRRILLFASALTIGGVTLLAHSGFEYHSEGPFTTLYPGAFGSTSTNENLFVNGKGVVRVRINADDLSNNYGTTPANAGVRLVLKNTPMWSLAAVSGGDFQIFKESGGSNAVYIKKDTLNVGIGTASPSAKLHVNGSLFVNGSITKTGGGEFVLQENPADPRLRAEYASSIGAEVGTYLRGTARLRGGEAVIDLPEHFDWFTEDDGLTVQLTPTGKWLRLYVVRKSTKRIVVREAAGKNGQFDYLIQGFRKGYRDHDPMQPER